MNGVQPTIPGFGQVKNDFNVGVSSAGSSKRKWLFPLFAILGLYRILISPALHFAGGPTCGCRFHPTCSVYAGDAFRAQGLLRGFFLAVRRVMKCNPFHAGGVDFCPPTRAVRPRCERISVS